MTEQEMMDLPTYDPNKLLDTLLAHLKLKNDAALARALGTVPPVISKLRHKVRPLGPKILIAMHEETGLSIKHLRALAGITASKVEFKRVVTE